jgi:hypothetical protein
VDIEDSEDDGDDAPDFTVNHLCETMKQLTITQNIVFASLKAKESFRFIYARHRTRTRDRRRWTCGVISGNVAVTNVTL